MGILRDIIMSILSLFRSMQFKIPEKKETKMNLYEYIKNLYKEHGATWDEINIFGIRDTSNMSKDLFNDYIGIAKNTGEVFIFSGTTDPGVHYTKNRLNPEGVAHLCKNFHENAYIVGIHAKNSSFAHEALVQRGAKVKLWRDNNENFKYDDNEKIEKVFAGINIHRTSKYSDPETIGRYSAGCQVIRNYNDFEKFMSVVKNSKSYKNNKKYRFSYLLININEVLKDLLP